MCLSVCVRAHARDRGSAGERLNRLSPAHPPKKRHGHDGINVCRLVAAAGGAAGQDAEGAGIAEKMAQRQRMRLSGQAISSPGPAARGEPGSQDVVDGGTRHEDGAQVPPVPRHPAQLHPVQVHPAQVHPAQRQPVPSPVTHWANLLNAGRKVPPKSARHSGHQKGCNTRVVSLRVSEAQKLCKF